MLMFENVDLMGSKRDDLDLGFLSVNSSTGDCLYT